MIWVKNFIKESQILYPSISETPFSVLMHLLLVNGNGHEIENGNFVKLIYNNTGEVEKINYSSFYKNLKIKEKIDNTLIKKSIDNFDYEDLIKPETWSYFITKEEYAPFIDLSGNFYKLHYFNKNTDKELIRVSIAFLKALINYIEKVRDISNIEKPLPVTEEIYKRTFKSLPKLKKEVERLLSLK